MILIRSKIEKNISINTFSQPNYAYLTWKTKPKFCQLWSYKHIIFNNILSKTILARNVNISGSNEAMNREQETISEVCTSCQWSILGCSYKMASVACLHRNNRSLLLPGQTSTRKSEQKILPYLNHLLNFCHK